MTALPCPNDEVLKVHRSPVSDIPFKIEPIAAFYMAVPDSEKQRMYLFGKQWRMLIR
jgi:hypothetical protein